MIKKGVRDCEAGYAILKSIAKQYKRPFTMLDIGANYGYFCTRLAEEFDCCCVAVEPECSFAQRFFELNDNHKVILLKHEFTLKSMQRLAQSEHFDIVLAYGVIHWLPADPITSLHAITDLGEQAVIELPFEEEGTVGQGKMKQFNQAPFNFPVIGHVKSHLVLGRRKVILVESPKSTITRKHVLNVTPIELHIQSSLRHKFRTGNGGTRVKWVNGINLMTLLAHDCKYPSFEYVKQCLTDMRVPKKHGDIRPWNIVFDGQRCTLIDGHDAWPTSNDKRDLDLLLNCNSYKDLLKLHYNDTKIYV